MYQKKKFAKLKFKGLIHTKTIGMQLRLRRRVYKKRVF